MSVVTTAVDTQQMLAIFEKQKRRSLLLRSEKIRDRKKRLVEFESFLLKNKHRVSEAIFNDFKKPLTESDISEVYPVLTEIRHTLAHLGDWAKPLKIDAPLTYLGTKSEVRYEPKG